MRIFISSLLIVIALAITPAASAATLISPFKSVTPPTANPKGEIYSCPAVPAAFIDLKIPELYDSLDPTLSVIKGDQEAAYQKAVAPLNAYLTEITKMANTYVRSNGRNLASAQCTLSWMNDWATHKALTGTGTAQGNFVRKWMLASISSAYVQIALDGRLDPKQKIEVKKWIQSLSKIIMDSYAKPNDISRRNHRLYWAAWAVGISSVAIQSRSNFDWAMDKAKIGLVQIEDDGTLPLEVRRGSRAQVYHLFATEALVMLAELGYKNGINLYAYNKDALHRLAAFDISQLDDPSYLKHRSGYVQKVNPKNLSSLIAWLEPYYQRFGFADVKLAKKAEELLRKERPLVNKRIGGDTTMLFEPGTSAPKSPPEQPASGN